jgi:UDPglucose 6-dehydrogenase
MKISMIGLGKLGLPCATAMSKHYEVVGYDLGSVVADFTVKPTISTCIENSDIIFVAVPTPHDAQYGGETPTSHLPVKDFDYTIVKDVLVKIAQYKTTEQQVVLISTVLPGTVRRELAPIISDIIYNPYLIAVGTVGEDFIDPEMIIIGHDNNPNVEKLIEIYNTCCTPNSRYEMGSWEDAEAIKIFYNTFISTKLALVNTVYDISQRLGNINVDRVTSALADCTRRIMSHKYMTAGLGDGGACHPRDNIALRWLANELDLGYDLFGSVMQVREAQAKNMAQVLVNYGLPVCILGQSYKPNVPNRDGSYALLVGHYVRELGGVLHYNDPLNNIELPLVDPVTYLISYHHGWLADYNYISGSIIVDPWRTNMTVPNCRVINL